MAVAVPEPVYDQIAAHKAGAEQQSATARAQAADLIAQADDFDAAAAGYAAILADLSVEG